jgi:DHA2 family methylenomycin A resistance protein-like MFS transporter
MPTGAGWTYEPGSAPDLPRRGVLPGASSPAAVAVVAVGLFLAVMSTTMVSVALPSIGAALDASPTELEWIVDAYVIVYSSLLVPGGAAGDRLGRKGLFLAGVATFGAGSLLASLAPSVGVLLAGRAVQGVGPALMIPGSLTIIRAVFGDEGQRALAIGLWSTASGLALAIGPAFGGLLEPISAGGRCSPSTSRSARS